MCETGKDEAGGKNIPVEEFLGLINAIGLAQCGDKLPLCENDSPRIVQALRVILVNEGGRHEEV